MAANSASSILKKIIRFIYISVFLGFIPLYLYTTLPVLNMWFLGVPMGLILLCVFVMSLETRSLSQGKKTLFSIATGGLVLSILYVLIISLLTWPGFRAHAYQELIGEVKQGESFSKDVAPIATNKIRIVDQDVAHRLGDKVLGEQPALGSQVSVGEFRIQKVKDQLYWVAPLLHSGFFKWLRNSEGTPAYVMVSATNERDVKLVQEVNGNPVRIKYQPEAFFGSYLPRHLYLKGFFNTGLTDYTFEIDDEGNPYWVVSLYTHEVGFAGANTYGIAVVNAATGETKYYTPENAPAWIDRIQPRDMVQAQLDQWGEYVNGYWNFSNQDKLTTTKGISLVYGQDNESYWYTGLTSVGRDQGTVGFILVNTRTKAATWYKQIGATENAARRSAMGKVQEKGYVSSFPIMYNINGVATYVMSLKDRAGLIKMISMVSVEDYSIVGVGDNLKQALRAYKDAYNSAGGNTIFTTNTKNFSLEGKIDRIQSDITGGNSYYYITLKEYPTKMFLGSSSISHELPLSRIQDSIKIWYEDGRSDLVDLTQFDNLGIKIEGSTTAEIPK